MKVRSSNGSPRAAGLAILLIAAAVGLLVAPSRALAHGRFVASEPAPGETVATAPGELRIWISEPISSSLSDVELQTIDGHTIPTDGTVVGRDGDQGLLTVALPPLEDGTYSAAWTVLSESDGHVTRGLVVFGVGTVQVDQSAFDAPSEDLPIGQGAARWLGLVALMALCGVCIIAMVVPASCRAARRAMVRWAVFWSLAGAAAGLVALVVQASAVTGAAPGADLARVATDLVSTTTWGRAWIIREVLYVVVAAALAMRLRSTSPALTRRDLAFLVGIVLSQALSSHAAGTGPDRPLAVTVDAVHLLSASTWVGGLAAMLVVRRHESPQWRRFGTIAVSAAAVLVATGLFATGLQVTSIDALIDTSYGRVLALKVGVVVGVIVLGGANAVLVRPQLAAPIARVLGRPPGWTPVGRTRLQRLVVGELGLGIVVIALTGLLTSLSPANSTGVAPPAATTAARSEVVDDMVITLNAQPNRPGDNVLLVHAASTVKPPVAPVDRVLLRFESLDDELGRQTERMDEVEPGRFRLGGSQLGRAGTWSIEVVVRRPGLPDASADFEWFVPVSADSEPRISDVPLRPTTTMLAVAVLVTLLLVVVMTVWVAGRDTPPRRSEAAPEDDIPPHDNRPRDIPPDDISAALRTPGTVRPHDDGSRDEESQEDHQLEGASR